MVLSAAVVAQVTEADCCGKGPAPVVVTSEAAREKAAELWDGGLRVPKSRHTNSTVLMQLGAKVGESGWTLKWCESCRMQQSAAKVSKVMDQE